MSNTETATDQPRFLPPDSPFVEMTAVSAPSAPPSYASLYPEGQAQPVPVPQPIVQQSVQTQVYGTGHVAMPAAMAFSTAPQPSIVQVQPVPVHQQRASIVIERPWLESKQDFPDAGIDRVVPDSKRKFSFDEANYDSRRRSQQVNYTSSTSTCGFCYDCVQGVICCGGKQPQCCLSWCLLICVAVGAILLYVFVIAAHTCSEVKVATQGRCPVNANGTSDFLANPTTLARATRGDVDNCGVNSNDNSKRATGCCAWRDYSCITPQGCANNMRYTGTVNVFGHADKNCGHMLDLLYCASSHPYAGEFLSVSALGNGATRHTISICPGFCAELNRVCRHAFGNGTTTLTSTQWCDQTNFGTSVVRVATAGRCYNSAGSIQPAIWLATMLVLAVTLFL